jgi:hypothetical protein
VSAPTPPPVDPLVAEYYTLMAAIGTGAKVVRFQDRTVEYQGTDEMIKAANWLYQQLAGMGLLPATGPNGATIGGSGNYRTIRCYTNKGL